LGVEPPDLRSGRSAEDGEPPPPPIAPGAESFAKKADDLESIRAAVDDAAAVGGALWFSYLFVLFYLAVAAGAVTHADLFLENPVKLPFLNIDLPLLAFFFLAPILFLFAHGYTLMHLVMLTEEAKDYDEALREQIGADSPVSDKLRRQLPSNIFIQYLAGPARMRKSYFGYALGFVAWTTLAVAPVLLLLLMQLQFLPFHNSFVTWTLRFVLVLDLALIWWLWGTIRSGRETGGVRGAPFWVGRILGFAVGAVLTIAAILFSTAVATFPGEWQEDHLPGVKILPKTEPTNETNRQFQQQPKSFWDWLKTSEKISLHDWIFNSPLDGLTSRRLFPFSNTLVLIGFNVLEALHTSEPQANWRDVVFSATPEAGDWHDFVFRARGRDLRGASFNFANLPRTDFTGACLEDASFEGAHLARAFLEFAQLQGAALRDAQLQGANLADAHLQGASLNAAQLQGASFVQAQLQGADLSAAQLQGTDLFNAQLQGADLAFAQLQGAHLGTQLQGASFIKAQLQGASCEGANLDAADLSGAFLWRADGSLESGKDLNLGGVVWGPFWRPFGSDFSPKPMPWSETAYQNLLKAIEALPAGQARNQAVERIGRLDCKAHTHCDTAAPPPPPGVTGFQAAASDEGYRKALAGMLKSIVCDAGDDDSIFALRSIWQASRFRDAGDKAPALIDFIMSPACPVSTKLTDGDRTILLKTKQDAIENRGG
jgi:uncharacterized protein YjbI with pentapeptide repeats